jgi:hypothetical protein
VHRQPRLPLGLLGIRALHGAQNRCCLRGSRIIHGCVNVMYLGKAIQWNSKDPRTHEHYVYIAKEVLHFPGDADDALI